VLKLSKLELYFFLQNLIVYLSSFSLLRETCCGEISVLIIDINESIESLLHTIINL